MTLTEIRNTTKEMLTPADVAPVLGCDPQNIRLQARGCPERLGFPVVRVGSRTKIPRQQFLRFMGDTK